MVPFATLPLVDKFRFRSQIGPLPWLLSIWIQKSPAAKSSSSASWCSCSAMLPPSLMVNTRTGSPARSGPPADPSLWYASPSRRCLVARAVSCGGKAPPQRGWVCPEHASSAATAVLSCAMAVGYVKKRPVEKSALHGLCLDEDTFCAFEGRFCMGGECLGIITL